MNSLTRSTQPRQDGLRDLRQEMDRFFGEFFPTWRTWSPEEAESAVWAPRVDVGENEDAYILSLDLPGVSKEDLSIQFQDGSLHVSGERKLVSREEEQINYTRVERRYGHFYRSFTLPKAVNAEAIQAHFENGVLTVHVPKAAELKPRKIEIQ